MRRLWKNGAVVSMDREMTRYEALGTDGETIVFLGSDREAMEQHWDEVRDLEGAMVLPGFTDTHMHLLQSAYFQKNVSLFGVGSMEELVERCRRRVEEEHPPYLLGIGWNQAAMAEGRMPGRADLDRISTEIPVCLLRSCIHIAACNSVMLEAIRGLDGVEAAVMAYVDFSAGLLREDAMGLYRRVIPAADDEAIRDLVRFGQARLNAAGITCVGSHDLNGVPGVDPIHVIHLLRGMEEELTVRIYEQGLVDEGDLERLLAVRSPLSDRTSRFRTGPLKILQDGSLGAKSACLAAGYRDDPDNHGIPIHSQNELERLIRRAHDSHMDVAVHAIGDLTLEQVCDAVEAAQRANPWPDHRHGIVHAQITTPALLQRMKDLGLQAYIQPIFIDADMEVIEDRVGPELAATSYNWRSMVELGLHVSGGSDCPVEPFHVLDNIRAAVTRKNRRGDQIYLPGQALTLEQALRLFTSDAAWASRDEDVRGTLEPGKLADLVVLDRDLFAVDPMDLPRVQVLETVVGGRTVYRR